MKAINQKIPHSEALDPFLPKRKSLSSLLIKLEKVREEQERTKITARSEDQMGPFDFWSTNDRFPLKKRLGGDIPWCVKCALPLVVTAIHCNCDRKLHLALDDHLPLLHLHSHCIECRKEFAFGYVCFLSATSEDPKRILLIPNPFKYVKYDTLMDTYKAKCKLMEEREIRFWNKFDHLKKLLKF